MKVLVFIATAEVGSTKPGDPYLSRFPNFFLMFLFAPWFFLTCYKGISIPLTR